MIGQKINSKQFWYGNACNLFLIRTSSGLLCPRYLVTERCVHSCKYTIIYLYVFIFAICFLMEISAVPFTTGYWYQNMDNLFVFFVVSDNY